MMSICPACHVYTSSGHRPDEQFSLVVLCLQLISKESCDSGKSFHQVTHTTLAEAIRHCSTLAPDRPMAVGNMYQRGYPSHSMTGGHDSVMSICLACHVYTSSCHRPDERFGAAVFCLQSMSNMYREFRVMSLSLVDKRGDIPSETLFSIFGGELTQPHICILESSLIHAWMPRRLSTCANSVYQRNCCLVCTRGERLGGGMIFSVVCVLKAELLVQHGRRPVARVRGHFLRRRVDCVEQ